jgi:lambda family phage portal protein
MKDNLLDKCIAYVAPQHGLIRSRARLMQQWLLTQERKYEAASQSRRTEGWYTPATSATAEIAPALAFMRERSRDLVRNNPHAERAVRSLTANLIGAGIIPQARSSKKSQNEQWNRAWQRWGNTVDCDADGLHNFYGLQTLIVRTLIEAGECLIRRRYVATSNSIPLQLQVLEPDFLDSTKTQDNISANDHTIIQGIEFNAQGQRIAYWLFQEHPGNGVSRNNVSVRVPADDIIHLYRVDRPGQLRGVPWAAPIIIKTKDLDDYDSAELVRNKIAACFAGFIRDVEGVDAHTNTSPISDKFEPGILEVLPPGKDIIFSNPPQVMGYADYVRTHLRAIAVGFGIPYEVLTSDYSQVNFSSARMGWLEFQRHLEQWQWQLIIPRLCDRVWQWFNDAMILAGFAKEPAGVSWTPPRREMIDPVKEVSALRDQVRCGFLTLSEAIRLFGYDPQEQLDEMAEDAKKLDALGLILDSDPRQGTDTMKSNSESNSPKSKSTEEPDDDENDES